MSMHPARFQDARHAHHQQLGAGGADVPRPEDTQGRAREARRKPGRVPGDAGGEAVASQAEQERTHQHLAVGGRLAEQVRGEGHPQQQDTRHQAPAIRLRPDTKVQP